MKLSHVVTHTAVAGRAGEDDPRDAGAPHGARGGVIEGRHVLAQGVLPVRRPQAVQDGHCQPARNQPSQKAHRLKELENHMRFVSLRHWILGML